MIIIVIYNIIIVANTINIIATTIIIIFKICNPTLTRSPCIHDVVLHKGLAALVVARQLITYLYTSAFVAIFGTTAEW